MTDAQLQGIAAQALNMAKVDLERNRFNFLMGSYTTGEGLHRMKQVEALIVEKLGEDWLNSGRKKDMGFGLLRQCVGLFPVEGLVFVCGSNRFEPTPKMLLLPKAEQSKLLNVGHDEHHNLVKRGLLAMYDALTCTAQTSERVCLYTHKTDDHHQFIGHPDVHFFAQKDFGGRLKMYGPEDADFGYGKPEGEKNAVTK